MTETLRNNPNGLDLQKNQRQEVLASLSERIWVTFESEEMAKAYFAESLWAELHEEWRKEYAAQEKNIDEEWKVKPRIKSTTDQDWIMTHGTDQVDIYYTPFKDLPMDKKESNMKAAREAIDLVFDTVMSWEVTDERIEEMSSIVHENRMKNNSWEKEKRPDLFVPYSELPEDEKVKDRSHILQAIAKIKAGK